MGCAGRRRGTTTEVGLTVLKSVLARRGATAHSQRGCSGSAVRPVHRGLRQTHPCVCSSLNPLRERAAACERVASRAGGWVIEATQVSVEERAVIRKVAWRLLPFLCFVYFIAYLDRVNVGFAALTMNTDLGLTATQFGFGAGVFFFSYFLFEVPSNFALQRFGARVWIARIMVTWGLVSVAMAFVKGPTSFAILRFLLGIAEAGFFPGMVLYLTCLLYTSPSPRD